MPPSAILSTLSATTMNQSSPSTPSESSPSESTSSPLTMEEAYNLCMTGDHFLPISDAVKDSNNVMELKYRLAMVELLRIKERILREHQLETPITMVSSAIEDAQLTIWRRVWKRCVKSRRTSDGSMDGILRRIWSTNSKWPTKS